MQEPSQPPWESYARTKCPNTVFRNLSGQGQLHTTCLNSSSIPGTAIINIFSNNTTVPTDPYPAQHS